MYHSGDLCHGKAVEYNYFRDYDPGIGRYVQSDPVGLRAGLNTYAYVDGSPLAFVDLKGLQVGRDRDGSKGRDRPDPRPPIPDPKPKPPQPPGKPGDPNCMGNCMKDKLMECPLPVLGSCAGICLAFAGTGAGGLGCAIGCSCAMGLSCYQLAQLQCSGKCDPKPGDRK
jgi:RHS repeat-associated protein